MKGKGKNVNLKKHKSCTLMWHGIHWKLEKSRKEWG